MPRYIDADALLETEPEVCADYGEEYGSKFGYSRDQIANAPTVSPDEVRGVGRWVKRFDGPYGRGRTYCSACGKHSGIGGIKQTPPYCPNCGAKMEVEGDA